MDTQTYEELCRHHVVRERGPVSVFVLWPDSVVWELVQEEYMKAASKFVEETGIAARVLSWQNKLGPILQQQVRDSKRVTQPQA